MSVADKGNTVVVTYLFLLFELFVYLQNINCTVMCTLVPGFNTSVCCSFLSLPFSGVLLTSLRMQSSSPLVIDCSELEYQAPILEIICRFHTSGDFAIYFIPCITVPSKSTQFFCRKKNLLRPKFNCNSLWCGFVDCLWKQRKALCWNLFSYFAPAFTVHINSFAAQTVPNNDNNNKVSQISKV